MFRDLNFDLTDDVTTNDSRGNRTPGSSHMQLVAT